MADYKDLELLVAKIQRELAPTAEVVHNVYLQGRKSGRRRQIDVLVRDRIGQYEIQIVIDCKDYKKPVDVKSVEEFYGLLDDVGAQKGVLVCPSGFSETAKTRAEGLQISLYSPVDTDPHKWRVNPAVPTVCDFRSAAISFGLSISAPVPFTMPYDFQFSNPVTDSEGNPNGSMFDIAISKWNKGELPVEPGRHEKLRIYGDAPHMDNGYSMNVHVDLWVGLSVQQELFYGLMPITRISGFKDEIGGGVITNAFDVGLLNPDEIFDTWKKIEKIGDAELPPVFPIQALVDWDKDYPDHNSLTAKSD